MKVLLQNMFTSLHVRKEIMPVLILVWRHGKCWLFIREMALGNIRVIASFYYSGLPVGEYVE